MVICFSVNMGLLLAAAFEGEVVVVPADVDAMAMEAVLMAAASSIIGSGELGGLLPDAAVLLLGGDDGAICRRRFSLFSSSLRLLATSAGVRGVSRNTDGDADIEEVEANAEDGERLF